MYSYLHKFHRDTIAGILPTYSITCYVLLVTSYRNIIVGMLHPHSTSTDTTASKKYTATTSDKLLRHTLLLVSCVLKIHILLESHLAPSLADRPDSVVGTSHAQLLESYTRASMQYRGAAW